MGKTNGKDNVCLQVQALRGQLAAVDFHTGRLSVALKVLDRRAVNRCAWIHLADSLDEIELALYRCRAIIAVALDESGSGGEHDSC
jgi:hypothetical protein